MDGYSHYIRINESNMIIKTFSTAFEQPQENDILVRENAERHFNLQIYTDRDQYRFKYANDEIIERTEQELNDEWDARPPDSPSRIDVLENENAFLLMELALTQSRLDQLEQDKSN